MEANNQPKQQEIQIKAKDSILAGVYSNAAQFGHTREEFVLDFMNIFPPSGTLNSRVIMSPGHFKRMIRVMQENLLKYESQFGPIQESKQADTQFGWPVK
jgi:hypothetical protein